MENDNSRQNMERGIKNKAKDGPTIGSTLQLHLLSMNKEDRISMLQPNLISLNAKSRNES
jgi:hypothetical protein